MLLASPAAARAGLPPRRSPGRHSFATLPAEAAMLAMALTVAALTAMRALSRRWRAPARPLLNLLAAVAALAAPMAPADALATRSSVIRHDVRAVTAPITAASRRPAATRHGRTVRRHATLMRRSVVGRRHIRLSRHRRGAAHGRRLAAVRARSTAGMRSWSTAPAPVRAARGGFSQVSYHPRDASPLAALEAAGAAASAGNGGAAPALDSAAPASSPQWQSALLRVIVNGEDQGDPIALLRRPDRVLVPRTAWNAWRLNAPAVPAVVVGGDQYVALNDIKGVRFDVDEAAQTLALAVSPELFSASRLQIGGGSLVPMTRSQAGGFLNYDVLVGRSPGQTSVNAALELGVFAYGGIGLTNVVADWDDGHSSLIRLDSSWTIDDPNRRRSLRLGDSISGGGTGGTPVRFAGVQFGSNFAVQPGFLTQPLPTVRGSAALPSVVDVYVNKNLAGSRTVAPGPFSIVDLPTVTGAGDVQLVVRDQLGRETLVTQSYYTAPQLLRAGLSAFSYEVGFLRHDYALASNDYGAMMASATHRLGVTNWLTTEIHGEATRTVQQAGGSLNMLWGSLGVVGVSGAASKSPDGTGGLVGATFERRTSTVSVGASAQYTTANYTSIGLDRDYRLGKLSVQSFIGMPVSFGSIGLSYTLRQQRSGADVNIASATATVRLPRIGTLHIAARHSLAARGDNGVQLFFTLPFRGRTSVSANAEIRDGRVGMGADIQRSLSSDEGIGYRASVATGVSERMDGAVTVQTGAGTYQVEASRFGGQFGVRAEAQGGVGLVGHDLFFSRSLAQSFAVVHVGDYSGVRVYADNQLIGKTNKDGVVVLPRLRAFDRNDVRIDVGDLPMDARFAASEQAVRPFNRHGVLLDFKAQRERSAMLTVLLDDGTALPDGSAVSVKGGAGDYLAAPGGEVYLSGLADHNTVLARWGDKSCHFTVDLPKAQDVQPNLGRFTCKADPA